MPAEPLAEVCFVIGLYETALHSIPATMLSQAMPYKYVPYNTDSKNTPPK